ncbi:COMM domain-containing protein 6-like [Pocillopora damicornis]|uniref:COMM domain-containing protein 6-like n=1 Tax=Pocillopora damicornis TaxID=46731 RepID=UPI000F54D8F4|nr:COMM domain-containing protein 6-like [Pocillopora damicornis]
MKMSQVFVDLPQGFNSAVEALNSVPQDILVEMCQDVAAFLQYRVALLPEEHYQKCLKDAGISYDAKLLLNAISYVFRSAAKAKLPSEKLIAELKSSLCWKENTLSVLKHVWNEQGKILSSSDLAQTLNVGQVSKKWCQSNSVGVSSSSCRSLNSPYITALVTVTDPSGAITSKSFEMTIGEFKKFASQMREIASVLETV